MKKILLWAVVILLSACARENIPFPSGALEGMSVPLPIKWSEVSKPEIIQFESNVAEPYSVNLWIVNVDEQVYIYAGDNQTTWVENLEKDPNGKLLVTGKLFDVVASRVTDAAEFGAFANAWDAKYGSEGPKDTNAQEAWLFRLAAR